MILMPRIFVSLIKVAPEKDIIPSLGVAGKVGSSSSTAKTQALPLAARLERFNRKGPEVPRGSGRSINSVFYASGPSESRESDFWRPELTAKKFLRTLPTMKT